MKINLMHLWPCTLYCAGNFNVVQICHTFILQLYFHLYYHFLNKYHIHFRNDIFDICIH